MKYIAFISILLILASCGSKDVKVIDLSDEIPTSKRNYDEVDTAVVVDSNLVELERFQRWNPKVTAIRTLERRSFLERFQPKKAEKFVLFMEDGDSMEYERMVFNDSIHTKSAFYNWLDHSGMAYFGANERIQRESFAMLYTDTVILQLSGAIDFKFWEQHFEDQKWMDEGDYWIKQRKYGKARWFVFQEEKLKDLTDP